MNSNKIFAQIFKNIKKKKWKCLVSNCNSEAINSHLIQRNGILSNIATDGHLVELHKMDAHNWSRNKSPITFRKIGVSIALSRKLFCNLHDSKIFEPVENFKTDFDSYESFSLFNYRVICNGIRKKHESIEINERIINANTLDGKVNKDKFKSQIFPMKFGITELEILKTDLEREIENPTGLFKFYANHYPKIDVYASAYFSVPDRFVPEHINDYDLKGVYIHILPLSNETLILTGYHNSHTTEKIIEYCKSWSNLSQESLEIKITNLFSSNIENFGISVKLFDQLLTKNKSEFLKLFRQNLRYVGFNDPIEFNLFKKK